MKLKALKEWSTAKRYIYGVKNIELKAQGVLFEIYADPINSGQKKMGHTERTSIDPKKIKYGASIKLVSGYHNGAIFNMGRNFSNKMEAKARLETVAEMLVGLNEVERYEKLVALSRKYY